MNDTDSVVKNKDELEREIDAEKNHIVVADKEMNDEPREVVSERMSPNTDVTGVVLSAFAMLGAAVAYVLGKAIDKGCKIKLRKSDFSLELGPGKNNSKRSKK